MRLLIRPQGIEEDPYHPDHNELDLVFGEMGQIIEWLIFGHMVEPSTRYPEILFVYCWGSNANMGNLQIYINTFAASRMFAARPPVRMAAAALRTFLATMALEEVDGPRQVAISGAPLADLDIPDPDEQYAGHRIGNANRRYRRAIQRIRAEEHQANEGLPPVLGVSRPAGERRIAEPPNPPGTARLFLRTGHVVFVAISGVAIYYCLSPNKNWDDIEDLATKIIALFELQKNYVLFIILWVVFFGFPGGRLGTLISL